MKITDSMKRNGELAMRSASEKAIGLYESTDPLVVFEYEDDEEKKYGYDGCIGYADGLTFDELNKEFEDLFDEFSE